MMISNTTTPAKRPSIIGRDDEVFDFDPLSELLDDECHFGGGGECFGGGDWVVGVLGGVNFGGGGLWLVGGALLLLDGGGGGGDGNSGGGGDNDGDGGNVDGGGGDGVDFGGGGGDDGDGGGGEEEVDFDSFGGGADFSGVEDDDSGGGVADCDGGDGDGGDELSDDDWGGDEVVVSEGGEPSGASEPIWRGISDEPFSLSSGQWCLSKKPLQINIQQWY